MSLIDAWNEYQKLEPDSLSLSDQLRTRMEITAKYQLGLFDLEKLITQMNALHLSEELVLDYSGTRSLTMGEFARRYFSTEWHTRDLPSLFLDLAESECYAPEEEKDVLIWAWTDPEWPVNDTATPERWRDVFRRIGFVTDDKTIEVPDSSVTLYRGEKLHSYLGAGRLGDGNARRMSWTSDRERALWFAHRFGTPGTVLERVADPTEIMAIFMSRGESEYVLDIDI